MDAGRHPNITLLSYSEVEEVTGYVGNFVAKVRKRARSVNEELCTGCGSCEEKCPRRIVDETGFNVGMGKRKAIYRSKNCCARMTCSDEPHNPSSFSKTSRGKSAGSSEPSTAARLTQRGRRAHQTWRRLSGGC